MFGTGGKGSLAKALGLGWVERSGTQHRKWNPTVDVGLRCTSPNLQLEPKCHGKVPPHIPNPNVF